MACNGRRSGSQSLLCFAVLLLVLLLGTASGAAGSDVTRTAISGNLTVTEGYSRVNFTCQVSPISRVNFVRWKFEGLVLATTDRYTVSVSGDTITLIIANVSIRDDGLYECAATSTANTTGLSSVASLSVLARPRTLEVVGYSSTPLVVVPYRADFVNLSCQATGARPPAELQWLKGGELLSTYVTADVVKDDGKRTFTTIKNLSIPQPGRELNKIQFVCVAKQPALNSLGLQMNVSRNLSVYYPPGAPQIADYQPRIMRPGDTLVATCTSFEGNPQPSVQWYKNNLPFFLTFISNEEKQTVTSHLVTTVNATDNDAIFRCVVKNDAITEPLYNDIKLNVKFAPSSVTISGNTKLRAGKTVTLTCTSAISNPAAVITWTVRSQIVQNATSQVDASPLGGFITTSNITVPIVQADDQVMYTCQATNTLLGQSAFTTALLEVFYPPSKPEIKGYNETGYLLYKTVVRLICTTIGGRPDPTLTWYKGSTILSSNPQKLVGSITTSEIEFIAQPNDNLASYKCVASNEATDEQNPLQAVVQLKVYFPPQNVTIDIRSPPVRENIPVTFVCDSGSSNPAPVMWWTKVTDKHDGVTDNFTNPAEFNGFSLQNRFTITPTMSDHGIKILCTARNAAIGESMTAGRTLDVHYKPYFQASSTVDVVLGANVSANFTANANPPATEYKWYKMPDVATQLTVDAPPFVAVGGFLTLVNAAKTHAGTYAVFATNAEGTSSFNFIYDIKFAPTIKSAECAANAAGEATCTCTAEANPMVDNMVIWKGKTGYNMTGKTQTYAYGTARITIPDVKMEDIGEFECTADNKQGEPAVQKIQLLVPIRPIISQEQQYSKAALTADGSAQINCHITSYPKPVVIWYHNGALINSQSGKFTSDVKDGSSQFVFRAELQLKQGNQSDYGSYMCVASTDRGNDSWSVLLEGTSVPDPPNDITVLNVTSSSILLTWKPGFDGGLEQHYVVRYRAVKATSKGYNYIDAHVKPPITFEITRLSPSTTFDITVAGANALGTGRYQPKSVSADTLVDPTVTQAAEDKDVTLIIILSVVIVGVIFLVLNAFLIVLFIRRRRRLLLLEESGSQANTELYGTTDLSAAGETDEAKSYTTYEKSVDCDDEYKHYEDDDDDEDIPQKGARYGPPPGTYLTDDTAYPPPPGQWSSADTASHNPYGYGSYSGQPLIDVNEGITPEGYAMELRNMGRTLPLAHMSDTYRRNRPSFVAGRPPAPPIPSQLPSAVSYPAEDSRAHELPPPPTRYCSPTDALTSGDNAYAISEGRYALSQEPDDLVAPGATRGHLV